MTVATTPRCHAKRRHRRAVEMVQYGTTYAPGVYIEHYECPLCGRVRRVEVSLFEQLTLFDDAT